jgi:glycosyltransferase involved in cell wall biosynthesis
MKIVVVIPVYDNPTTIAAVMRSCLTTAELPLIVVDDGSAVPVEKLAAQDPLIAAAFKSGRCKIFRHEKNAGKGMALKTAFREAMHLGYSHVLTLDGDGQHFPEDLLPIIKTAAPNEIVIGSRQMDSQNSPRLSRIGRTIADFWIKLVTRQTICDSQSGVRLYPLEKLGDFTQFGERYDFEMQVLIHLLWQGVRPRSVNIRVHYPVSSLHISHFKKVRDNYRIVAANIRMIAKR